MTYYVTAHSNDQARLIIKTLRTDDAATAECVADMWDCEGYIIARMEEG